MGGFQAVNSLKSLRVFVLYTLTLIENNIPKIELLKLFDVALYDGVTGKNEVVISEPPYFSLALYARANILGAF